MSDSKDKTDNFSQVAIEELKLLSEIVARHDNFSYQVKNWAITISSGILVVITSGKIKFGYWEALILIPVINLLFLWIDVIHRVAMNRAISRHSFVEKTLREGHEYDGPKISESLSKPSSLNEQLKALNNIRIYSSYLFVCIVCIFIIVFFHK